MSDGTILIRMEKNILVTGGTGYIGSHAAVALAERGYSPVLLDNLSNSAEGVAERVSRLAGRDVPLVVGDVRDGALLDSLFAERKFSAVIHFAALKAVGESVERPLDYFDNNVGGTLSLLRACERANVKTLVFSSSATVYGDPDRVPIPETAPLRATNPYGRTKLIVEGILEDLAASDREWRVALLRYFNPIGAHPSGLIGEDPNGVPNNLLPFVAKVAGGELSELTIYGNDYPTPDGTGVRDYLHVVDLAEGHVTALEYLEGHPGCRAFNLGTGKGSSVLDVVKAFEAASGAEVPRSFAPRRPGDVAECYADPSLAERELGWKASRTLDDACRDLWNWQTSGR